MSDTTDADSASADIDTQVIQGRLGWEAGDISEANPAELNPHPKNEDIYGDTEDSSDLNDTFKRSVAEKGVLEPLVITEGKQIISGHRRWLAAQDADLGSVPVRFTEFDSELAEREALIEFNRQREKTPGQIVNEFEEMLEIEQDRATQRQSDGGNNEEGRENFPHPVSGKARNKAAEKVNADVSGRTLEKGYTVKKKAEEGDETAQEEWQKLQTGDTSFHRAKKNVEKAEAEQEIEQQREASTDETTVPVVEQADATDLLSRVDDVDLLLTDPPYTTDVADVRAFAESWLPKAIEVVGDDAAFIFVGAYSDELQAYLNVLDECGVRERTQVLVWTYRNTLGQSPSDEYKRNWQAVLFVQSVPATELNAPLTTERWAVQDVNAPDGRHDGRHHKWEKPTELLERFIRHTTEEGDTVLDPFVGTGTTALVADDLGREIVAGDESAEMLELAEDRGCRVR
jgi:ParB-like chromosome segregation protein Spo0J